MPGSVIRVRVEQAIGTDSGQHLVVDVVSFVARTVLGMRILDKVSDRVIAHLVCRRIGVGVGRRFLPIRGGDILERKNGGIQRAADGAVAVAVVGIGLIERVVIDRAVLVIGLLPNARDAVEFIITVVIYGHEPLRGGVIQRDKMVYAIDIAVVERAA